MEHQCLTPASVGCLLYLYLAGGLDVGAGLSAETSVLRGSCPAEQVESICAITEGHRYRVGIRQIYVSSAKKKKTARNDRVVTMSVFVV